ncbi:MAG: DUF4012 domain-containing protein [Actinomycetota bacterium]
MTADRSAARDGAQPPAPTHSRVRVRIVLLAVAALTLVLAGLTLLDAMAVANDLRSGRVAFKTLTDQGLTGDGKLAVQAKRGAVLFAEADRRARRSVLLGGLGRIPFLGRPARWLQAASDTAARLGEEAAASVARIEPRLKASGEPTGRLELISLVENELARLGRLVGDIRLPSTGGFLPPVIAADRELRWDLARLKRALVAGTVTTKGLRTFLAGPSTYVVLAANNAEMRSGGMVLQVGVLQASAGRVQAGGFRSTGEVALSDPVPLPPELESLYGWLDPDTEWRNLGTSPNFPGIGPVYASMAQRSGLSRVDGVLQIDVLGVRALLEVIGPIEVDGRRYDPSNVEKLMMHDLYVAYGDEQFERRHEFSRLAAEAFRVLTERSSDLGKLAKAVSRAAAGRHLLAWSARPDEQRAWERLGMDGRLERDGFMATVQNHGGNKLDWYVRSSVELAVERPEGRFRRVRAKIRIENLTPPGEPPYVAGNGVIVPKNVYRAFVAIYLPGWATNVELVGREALVIGTDGPMRVVATRLDIRRARSEVVEVVFSVPPGMDRIVVLPSARSVPVPFRIGDRTVDDSAKRALTV